MMKIKNTTDLPDHFLRRMTAWCAKQLDLPVRYLREAKFGNRRGVYSSGRSWSLSRRIHVSLSILGPHKHGKYVTKFGLVSEEEAVLSRYETLVSITAHELFHQYAHYAGINSRRHGRGRGSSERQTERHEQMVLESFRKESASLLAAWMKASQVHKPIPKPTLQEKRAEHVERKLSEWERKLKAAQKKVREYRKKRRYYNKALAAKRSD